MPIRKLIEKLLKTKGEVRSSEIVKKTGLSRAYVNRIFQKLEREGKLRLVGKANRARYVPATPADIDNALRSELTFRRLLNNVDLEEDVILQHLRQETGILHNIRSNIRRIVEYGFTEMLNNAIEHSNSDQIVVEAQRDKDGISFTVLDRGVGIFNKIMADRNLSSEREAIQDLLKGKQSTAPHAHSGEGIFFTSKAADLLEIKSSSKKILFDNRIDDIFLRDIHQRKGTQVDFRISLASGRRLAEVFRRYSDDGFIFDKTSVFVELYKMDNQPVSRSQARRILSGLEKFHTIILDFKKTQTIGQAFADEIFRVWKVNNPGKHVVVKNANDNIRFMIDHVQSG